MEKEYITLAIVGLILSFGLYVPTYFLLWLTPIYNKFKWPGRHLIIVNFALCVLAGMSPYANYVVPIAILELFWYGKRFLYLHKESDFYPPQEIIDYFKDKKGSRILTLHQSFPQNATIPLEIVNITGYDPFILKSYHQRANRLQWLPRDDFGQTSIKLTNITQEFLDELRVEYIYTTEEFEGFEIVVKTDKANLLKRK
jgi:hypothetical protein